MLGISSTTGRTTPPTPGSSLGRPSFSTPKSTVYGSVSFPPRLNNRVRADLTAPPAVTLLFFCPASLLLDISVVWDVPKVFRGRLPPLLVLLLGLLGLFGLLLLLSLATMLLGLPMLLLLLAVVGMVPALLRLPLVGTFDPVWL